MALKITERYHTQKLGGEMNRLVYKRVPYSNRSQNTYSIQYLLL